MRDGHRLQSCRFHIGIRLPALALCLAILLVSAGRLSARPAGGDEAERVVAGWLGAGPRPLAVPLGREIAGTDTFTDQTGEPLYYVVYLRPKGYVIVPAETEVEPIICIVQDGTFNAADDNPLGAIVGRDIPARVNAVRAVRHSEGEGLQLMNLTGGDAKLEQTTAKARQKWSRLSADADTGGQFGLLNLTGVSDVRRAPLVKSKWGQTTVGGYIGGISCYNYYTPPYEAGDPCNYPCGCVATAMVQVMRYNQWPSTYNWSNMPLVPNTSITLSQRQAIGQLCYDVAESVDTTYDPNGSGATLADASLQLRYTFDYSNSIRSDFPRMGADFFDMVNSCLDGGHPMLLGVESSSYGHAVICDGYGYNQSTMYHHLNMGWSGYDDAWYALPEIDAYYDYDVVATCVYNIYVNGGGEMVSGRVTDQAGDPITAAAITAYGSGGPYEAVTDGNGVYALQNVPSFTSLSIDVQKPPYVFESRNVSTGRSRNGRNTSGNLWGVDFVSQQASPPTANDMTVQALAGGTSDIKLDATDDGLPDPPGKLTYTLSSLPTHGRVTDPEAGPVLNVPYTLANDGDTVQYRPCRYYAGPDSFQYTAGDGGTPPTGGDSLPATVTIDVNDTTYTTFAPQSQWTGAWPMRTSYHDSRTQVIYPADEIRDANTITGLGLDVETAPGQTLQNWTIRMKHTTLSSYGGEPLFETTGWTTVFQDDVDVSSAGWHYLQFTTEFGYDGTSNLLIDFSHNNSSSSTDGECHVSDTGSSRVLMSWADSTAGDPLDWTSYTAPGLNISEAVPNIRLGSRPSGRPLQGDFEPDCDVDIDDLITLVSAWMSGPGDEAYNDACDTSEPYDIINMADLAILAANWLKSIE